MLKKSLLAYSLLLSVILTACSDETVIPTPEFPLKSLSVKVGETDHLAIIDHETRRIELNDIANVYLISDVSLELKDEQTTVVPDPSTFLYRWKKEQQLTVITADGDSVAYTLAFPLLDNSSLHVLYEDNFDTDGIPDTSKWVLCVPQGADWNAEMSESYEQAYVKDGALILSAIKEDGVYKAGGIKSMGKWGVTLGKIEVRARIARHPDGAFPAIWMMPQKQVYPGYPQGGEIDLMEHVKQEPVIHHTIHTHYTFNLHQLYEVPNSKSVACDYEAYNVYGLEWTPEKLQFYVNGEKTFSYPNLHLANEPEVMQWPFTKDSEFYLILNMGLGGSPLGWAGAIDDKNLPAELHVDWVRVSSLDY